MGLFSRSANQTPAVEQVPAPAGVKRAFSVTPSVTSTDFPWLNVTSTVSRDQAMTVPAVKRARDLICNTIGSLPLGMYASDNSIVPNSFLSQPEVGITSSVTYSRLAEDLLFYGVAWLQILSTTYDGRPSTVVRLDPASVTVQQGTKVYVTRSGHQGSVVEYVPDDQLILFRSPTDGLLKSGARAIRTCLDLDAAAARFASGVPPMSYLTSPDADLDQDDATDVADSYATAIQTRTTPYLGNVEVRTIGWSPEQLQMADARNHAVGEIARLVGINAEDLDIPGITTGTYFNAQDRDKQFINRVLAPYLEAISGRLSLADVTPRGYTVRHDYSAFLRADDATRMGVAVQGLSGNVFADSSEARDYFGGLPELPISEVAGNAPTAQ